MHIEVKASELQKIKLFVATPMYGGQCAGMYSKAAIDLATMCANYGVECRFFFIFNESLITRARNYLVDEFLRAEEFTHLMFIDSDINFNPKDVLSLAVLSQQEDKPIIGGPYGKKCIAWERIRTAVDVGIADEDPNELSKFTVISYSIPVQGTQNSNEPVEVLEIATGFMMCRREVCKWKRLILNLSINLIIIDPNISRVIDTFMHILILLSIMKNICLWDHLTIQIDICQKIMPLSISKTYWY